MDDVAFESAIASAVQHYLTLPSYTAEGWLQSMIVGGLPEATARQIYRIYGSLATVVVVLLFLETVFIILLLGAQVIAELEASSAAGLPWYEKPRPA